MKIIQLMKIKIQIAKSIYSLIIKFLQIRSTPLKQKKQKYLAKMDPHLILILQLQKTKNKQFKKYMFKMILIYKKGNNKL